MRITSSIAFIIYLSVMISMYLMSISFEQLPFLAFATQITLGFIAYVTKRLIGRKK